MKKCSQCRVIQSYDNYSPSINTRGDGYQSWCKKCRNRRGHPSRTPTQVRADNLWKKYRIRVKDYEAMAKDQNGKCAICGTYQLFNNLVVDHCHDTGKVRALLCKKCNTGIGMFRDDPNLLELAIAYILIHKEEE